MTSRPIRPHSEAACFGRFGPVLLVALSMTAPALAQDGARGTPLLFGALQALCFTDDDGGATLDTGEVVYVIPAATCLAVMPPVLRLHAFAGNAAGTQVRMVDAEVQNLLTPLSRYDARTTEDQRVYLDFDRNGMVSTGDLRLSSTATLAGGRYVQAGDGDSGSALPGTIDGLVGRTGVIDNDGDAVFSKGDHVVLDLDGDGTATAGDLGLSTEPYALGTHLLTTTIDTTPGGDATSTDDEDAPAPSDREARTTSSTDTEDAANPPSEDTTATGGDTEAAADAAEATASDPSPSGGLPGGALVWALLAVAGAASVAVTVLLLRQR